MYNRHVVISYLEINRNSFKLQLIPTKHAQHTSERAGRCYTEMLAKQQHKP